MKLYDYVNLEAIFNEVKDMKLPFKTSYKFTKLFKIAEEQINFYHQELKKLLAEYGEKGSIKPEYNDLVDSKIKELLNLNVEESNVNFSINELENLNLTITQMNSLMPFIKE